MSKNIQIRVTDPCGENWDDMQASGNGRHCSSCLKTVVDFSLMSDQDVLSWLADTNKNVCGRFAADQLNRGLVPALERKRRGWAIWNFLLAGLLVSSKAPAQTKVSLAPVTQCDKKQLSGEPLIGKVRVEADTPKFDTLPPVVVQGYSTISRSDIMGDVVIVGEVTVGHRKTSWVMDLVKDTLALVGISKKEKELTLYPNPAFRGTGVRLSLSPDLSGACKLELFNGAGSLLQARSLEWTHPSQIESLNIPASLPAGGSFLKLYNVGTRKVYTQKLVVF